MSLPSGTVTFLFTDIEGSTALWERHAEEMRVALARHDGVLRQAVTSNRGYTFKTVGDSFHAAFASAPDALRAAVEAQVALSSPEYANPVGLRVRMALHTGAAELRDDDYFGQPLNRVARLLATCHGGQVLLSDAARTLVLDRLSSEIRLKDLGTHRLRDLSRPEAVFQVCHPDLRSDFPPLRSLDNPELPNNLPLQVNTFIGREQEVEEVKQLVATTRLVTLIGCGGSGKSRLALQVAAEMVDGYRDGTWLVELAALRDPNRVASTIAATLGCREEPGKAVGQTLTEYLKSRNLLLVLDNCEHLLLGCGEVINGILRSCSNVHILATSREPLTIAGESAYRVPSLRVPPAEEPETAANVTQYDSVRLFIDRATLCSPSFTVTDANALALSTICRRLDGIPLAIELAAARVRGMAVERISERLHDAFHLLTAGNKAAPPRH